MTLLSPGLRCMTTKDQFTTENSRVFGTEEIIDIKKILHEQKRQLYLYGMQINLSKEHCGYSHEGILCTFVGAVPILDASIRSVQGNL